MTCFVRVEEIHPDDAFYREEGEDPSDRLQVGDILKLDQLPVCWGSSVPMLKSGKTAADFHKGTGAVNVTALANRGDLYPFDEVYLYAAKLRITSVLN